MTPTEPILDHNNPSCPVKSLDHNKANVKQQSRKAHTIDNENIHGT